MECILLEISAVLAHEHGQEQRDEMEMSQLPERALHMFNRGRSKARRRLIKLNFCGRSL
jgi:hypothetical protein